MCLVLIMFGNIRILQIYWVSSFTSIFIFASPNLVWQDSAWNSFGWHLWFGRIAAWHFSKAGQSNTYPNKFSIDLTCEGEILPATISASHLSWQSNASSCWLLHLAFYSWTKIKRIRMFLCVCFSFSILPSDIGRWKHTSQNANANKWYCFRMSEQTCIALLIPHLHQRLMHDSCVMAPTTFANSCYFHSEKNIVHQFFDVLEVFLKLSPTIPTNPQFEMRYIPSGTQLRICIHLE